MAKLSSIFSLLLLCTCFLQVNAQSGDLFLRNYDIPLKNIEAENFAAAQGGNGLMYFANKKGIISYDGVAWEIIRTNTTPYSLTADSKVSGRVYVGCRNDFGYLQTLKTGKDQYVSLLDKKVDCGEINRIILTKEFAYFYSEKAVFQVSLKSNKIIHTWQVQPDRVFMGMTQIGEKIYINIRGKGLYLLQDKSMTPVSNTGKYADLYIKASIPFDSRRVLLGLSDHSTYLFDGRTIESYVPAAKDYIKGNVIQTGLTLGNDKIALGTLSGGVIIVNKNSNETEYMLNYQTGLPDDEVFALCTDKQGGIWICHAQGISRADMRLPVRAFSGYAGLVGNVESLITVNDSLFVATSDGLFYLFKVNRYEEVEGFIRKEQKYVQTVETVTRTVKISEPQASGRLRRYQMPKDGFKPEERKIEIGEELETKRVPVKAYSTETITSLFSTKEAREAYALQSIPYIFKKVEGLDAKCRQMIYHKGSILVASNLGLYKVNNQQSGVTSQAILPNTYVNFMLFSERNPDYLYVASNEGLVIMHYEAGNWKVHTQIKEAFKTAIYSIMEQGQLVWLGAESRVFKATLDENYLPQKLPQKYEFPESFSEDVIVRTLKGQPAFILSSGIYSYSAKTDKMFKNPRLDRYFNARSRVFYQQKGYTWIKNTAWQNISQPSQSDTLKTIFLDFFNNLEEVYVDKSRNIWLVDNNNLYRISANADIKKDAQFNTYIRNIYSKSGEFLPLDRAVFDYNRQALSLTFKLATPFYQGEGEIEYQYWLEGLSEGWSEWNTQAVIAFPFLPSGEYKLHVRARNIFEQQSQEKVFAFKVEPPFWETYWFYGLQLVILLTLLILSFLFNRSGKRSRLSFVLSLISIITIFEFLFLLFEPYVDNVANGIPVLKLGMNIMLALSLSPLERFLRSVLYKTPVEKAAEAPPEDTLKATRTEDVREDE